MTALASRYTVATFNVTVPGRHPRHHRTGRAWSSRTKAARTPTSTVNALDIQNPQPDRHDVRSRTTGTRPVETEASSTNTFTTETGDGTTDTYTFAAFDEQRVYRVDWRTLTSGDADPIAGVQVKAVANLVTFTTVQRPSKRCQRGVHHHRGDAAGDGHGGRLQPADRHVHAVL